MQIRVDTAAVDKFVVSPPFNNLTFVHHDDHIGILDRGNTMTDNDARPVFHHTAQALENGFFRVRIHRREGIVEDKNFRFPQNCPRNARPLLLSTRQCDAPFAKRGLKLLGKIIDVFCDLRNFRSLPNLFLRNSIHSVADVFRYRLGEQKCFLRYIANMGTQNFQWNFLDIDTVEKQLPFCHVVQTGEQVDKRALAGAGIADDGERGALGNFEVDIL